MARVVFFSFDYDDVFRVNLVRNSGTFVGERRSGFRDKAEYEQVKLAGDAAIRRWITRQMQGCSVTCVLVGQNTNNSKWVNFEIAHAISQGMGLLAIRIHHLNAPRSPGLMGALLTPPNPLDTHTVPGRTILAGNRRASDIYETHTWAAGGLLSTAQNRLGDWVEEAARRAGR